MSDQGHGTMRPLRHAPLLAGAALVLLVALAPIEGAAHGPDHPHVGARQGVEQTRAAAVVWAPDAFLVYLENDETLDPDGAAERWGYLYFSPGLKKARAYSVRDGKILVAEDLEMTFEAPPLASQWIDSGAALAAAGEGGGKEFCRDHEGRLDTMLLTRGAFQDGDPDATTWTVIYGAPHAASLFVVVDATDGKVRRVWRG